MRWIEKIISQYGFSVNAFQTGVETTRTLNEFLEGEILLPYPKLRFAEWGGFLRRGSPEYNPSVPSMIKKHRSAAFFEREEWPTLLWNPANQPMAFAWVLNYEKAPEFLSSASIIIGYQFHHDYSDDATIQETQERIQEIAKQPFFLGNSYHRAPMLAPTIGATIELLRVTLQDTLYQREMLNAKEIK